ncbi:nuclear transport factor 2 family protein [Nocardioides sp. AE5]|uniref:nuclear transport factor 2 family protein n=1 Tax=Nocardioides sp. AE5 TaxID=2962573 RepID=UPI002882603A|nr:nuclear transport factor 2 family protein [Nocardioides sp. AE5]MDT0202265.1 nuclear transport factor 2 family protein [Nocardioides sp. AE5]
MSTPAEIGLARWHALVASQDPSGLREMIAEDAVFRSPAVHRPQEGRDLVQLYLTGAINVLGPTLSYADEWVRERDAILEFTANLDDLEVSGIDRITWDEDGQIVAFTVMVRPVSALNRLIEKMGAELSRLAG